MIRCEAGIDQFVSLLVPVLDPLLLPLVWDVNRMTGDYRLSVGWVTLLSVGSFLAIKFDGASPPRLRPEVAGRKHTNYCSLLERPRSAHQFL